MSPSYEDKFKICKSNLLIANGGAQIDMKTFITVQIKLSTSGPSLFDFQKSFMDGPSNFELNWTHLGFSSMYITNSN